MKLIPISIFPNTADTESGPNIHIDDDQLTISYSDYKNDNHKYEISEIVSFRFEGSGLKEYEGFSDDDQMEVMESSRITELKNNGDLGVTEIARHILIGFNEKGGIVLDIIFSGQIKRC